MLRNFVLACGVALLAAGAISLSYGGPAIMLLIFGAVAVGGVVFEQVVYKRVRGRAPGPGWVRTAERFVDPETGETLTVYEQPATGERAYVRE